MGRKALLQFTLLQPTRIEAVQPEWKNRHFWALSGNEKGAMCTMKTILKLLFQPKKLDNVAVNEVLDTNNVLLQCQSATALSTTTSTTMLKHVIMYDHYKKNIQDKIMCY